MDQHDAKAVDRLLARVADALAIGGSPQLLIETARFPIVCSHGFPPDVMLCYISERITRSYRRATVCKGGIQSAGVRFRFRTG